MDEEAIRREVDRSDVVPPDGFTKEGWAAALDHIERIEGSVSRWVRVCGCEQSTGKDITEG